LRNCFLVAKNFEPFARVQYN